jgi:hypothetical protein
MEVPGLRPMLNTARCDIPFIDYARGDGLSIGPGQEQEWSPPILLTPEMGWVENYRGCPCKRFLVAGLDFGSVQLADHNDRNQPARTGRKITSEL